MKELTLFEALNECERIWKFVCENGFKPDTNYPFGCAACAYMNQRMNIYNKWYTVKCDGYCIIKWDDENSIVKYKCEQSKLSPYRKFRNIDFDFSTILFKNKKKKKIAKKVLEKIKEAQKYYEILFKKF